MQATRQRAWRRARPRTSAALIVGVAWASAASAVEPVVLHGRTMGTTYNVRYWRKTDAGAPSPPDVQRSIDALLARFDEQMSTWRSDSELARFNAAQPGQWFPVSADTARVVARAIELHERTAGASDVTVAPLLRLWGFGPSQPKNGPRDAPSEADIAAAQMRVGAKHLQARMDPPALKKDLADLEVDLSSIAPGYAIDLIIDQLASAGIDNAMVELGGEVRAVGVRPDGKPWRIGVQSLPTVDNAIAAVVPLANLALATSGDFQQFHMVGGEQLTHILDPRTGHPLPYRGASVTVVAPKCFAADGLATALFVMGSVEGAKWCADHNVAALFQEVDDDGRVVTRKTPRFQELIP